MTKCTEFGCRNIEWKCADCGRVVMTGMLENMGEWRDVKDPPPDHEHVLVFDTQEGICRGYVWGKDWTHYPLGSYASDGCLFHVTHWMPLPKPPETK